MDFEGSPSNLKQLLATEDLRAALAVIEAEAADCDRVSPVGIGSDGWELKIAERSGKARGLLRAIDILNELTEEKSDGK
ncbi:MAG: hypothetical protein BMS9Abin11_1752 [Gammaproteobacteria bacterium]|nr:MAG: hypothetical protein BMS9Abin11_1752 [Gammaproteobacteria bacterium]